MVTAIIFDCFGVLATDGLLPFRERQFGTRPELLEEASSRGKQVDAGLASYDDYIAWLAEQSGLEEATVRHEIENNVPDERLFAYIKEQLKPSYKIGMLSNAGDNWLDEIFTPEQIALFDAVVLSYQTGFIKPNPRAYETIAEKLGCDIKNCIFVDDQERYCTAAREVGMQAVYYQNFEQGKRELEVLLSQSEKPSVS